MEGNILNNGKEGLQILRDKLVQLDRYQNDNSLLDLDEKKVERSIVSKETAIEDELNLTIKKRKEEIEATYDQEISKTKDQIKKVEIKKLEAKNAQISERIDIETSDLRDEYEQMRLETINRFKEDKIARSLNSRLFFALYMPRGAKDFGIIAITLMLLLIVIPCGIYFLILPEKKVIYLVIIYVLTVLIFGALYFIIASKTKDKHLSTMKEVRQIRDKMSKNKAKRKKIEKRIRKDKDESVYSLDYYDEEIKKFQNDIDAVADRKKEAIATFDNNTRTVITKEIRGRHEEELLDLKTKLNHLSEKIRDNNENIKYLSLELVDNYEAYLGKEFMSVEKIDKLVELMVDKNLQSISEAIAMYRKSDS